MKTEKTPKIPENCAIWETASGRVMTGPLPPPPTSTFSGARYMHKGLQHLDFELG